jgi:PPK2 family polyphosphate:nucleotide phosphotransferase
MFRVKPGKRVRLADYDPAWTGSAKSKDEADRRLARNLERLTKAQDLLWASNQYALLMCVQGMDAAGKDGLIKHVMSGVNPQGCDVHSFKQPSKEELDHNFLWRYSKAAPERGKIGIFNRSYFEEVLVVRVHPELLEHEGIPDAKPGRTLWDQRYEDINNFEEHLSRNGTVILKFFLNVSKEEQKRRLIERLEDPQKHWKFSPADLTEREYWDDYMEAYEDALTATSTKHAPWYVIPADHKWEARWLVSEILADTIGKLDLRYPKPTAEQRAAIAEAKKKMLAEDE